MHFFPPPFFELNLGHVNEISETLYSGLKEICFAEISLYEAKFKLISLYRRGRIKEEILESFWRNLEVLRADPKVKFIPYDFEVDNAVNELEKDEDVKLDAIDEIIVATAIKVGYLVTMDREILGARERLKSYGLTVLNPEEAVRAVNLRRHS